MKTATVRIARGTIDLSNISGYCDGEEDEVVRKELRKQRLYGDDFLYTIFDYGKVRRLLETGATTSECLNEGIIYAFNFRQFVWDGADGPPANTNIPSRLAKDYLPSGLAVFDREFLENGGDKVQSDYGYVFKNPHERLDALRGVFKIKLPGIK